jgi:putative ABC transport system permease protein
MGLAAALRASLESLRGHALRSVLAMLGMIFGVGAVIAMLSIGAGAQRQALQLVDALGARNVLVQARDPQRQDELFEVRKKSVGLSQRDADALLRAVPGVERVAKKRLVEPWKVLAPGGRAKPRVLGVSASYGALMDLRLGEGRFLDDEDEATYAQVCVLGERVRRELFGFEPALGRPVRVNDQWLTVVGVLRPSPVAGREVQGFAVAGSANDLYLPVTTAERKFVTNMLASPLDELVLATAPGASVHEVAAAAQGLVERLHNGADDTRIVVPAELVEQSRRTRRLFDLVMGCIAGISLLVGGIGIMNIMLATVLERTREIGLRRAVGARRADVRNQFLMEAFALSAAGGVLGVVLGVVLARIVAAWAGWDTLVTPASILLASGVSLAVGLASGFYPARRAARLDPIEALRYE